MVNRNPEKKTRHRMKEEKKKAIKAAAKQELIDLRQHLTTAEKSRINPLFPIAPTRCNQCGKVFGSFKAAKDHRTSYGYNFCCPRSVLPKPTCGCIFSNYEQLRQHMDYHKKGVPVEASDEEGSEAEEEEVEEEMPEDQ